MEILLPKMLTKKASVAKINTLQLVARVLLFNGVHPDVVEAIKNSGLELLVGCGEFVVKRWLLVKGI